MVSKYSNNIGRIAHNFKIQGEINPEIAKRYREAI